ncbi:Probable RNA-directed DNA polymerase from transposon BS [Eumeta japonica]|uniref:Probable RNA-directed DNA polymerase from transposon BS n=1 Tax=Eumeta variegata TaxID=151549 RepID=A0A4C1XI30_EUMVA|nr:Probable RNA-directed DNA polymerase from transposon BS [Eumeta japonica]
MARPTVAVQWNSQSVRRDKSDLIFFLQKYYPTVAAASDIWLRPDSHFVVPGFVSLRDDGSAGYFGVAVLIKNHAPFSPVSTPTRGGGLQAVAVKFEGIDSIIDLINYLNSASKPTSCADTVPQTMLSVADDMFPLKKHLVVGIPSPPCKTLINLSKIRAKSRRFLRSEKLEGWRGFYVSISPDGSSHTVCKQSNKFRNSCHGAVSPYLNISECKGNPDDPAAYCLIALSSVLAKIAEHLVKNRLEGISESHSLSQYGFRKSRNTIDSLSIFISDIRVSFFQGKSVTAAFLDVSSAYDNVQLPIPRNKIHKLKVPERLSNFIFNLLSERRILRIDSEVKASRLVWKGLPQGSVLNLLLYNMYISDLELSISPCKILQYADDLFLYFSDTSVFNVASVLSESLKALQLHIHSLGLELSAFKSNLVVFSRRETGNGFPVKILLNFLVYFLTPNYREPITVATLSPKLKKISAS